MSQIKKTAKHSAIYATGTMLRRITGLVMLPIYTRYLTPADYGAVELLTMAIELAGILVGLRISQAMFRYYLLAESEEEKRTIVSTVLITVLGSSMVGALILCFSADLLSRLLFGSDGYAYEFQLFSFILVFNAGIAVGQSYLRARQMPVVFVLVGVTSLALQVALNIYFVVMLELHVTGVVYSALISGAIIMTGLVVYLVASNGIHFSVKLTNKLFHYVYPLIIASLGAFYAAYADKYFLRVFGGLSDVGLYVLAARVASVIGTVFEAFNMSWGADRFEVVKRDNASEVFERVFRYLCAGMLLIGGGLSIFAHDFFTVMSNKEFHSAAYIVPLLVTAYLARLCMMFCNFGALYRDSTMIMAQAAWAKAILASVGYVALIPLLGVYGAATALVLANILEAAIVYRKSTALYDMGLRWMPVFTMYASAVVAVAVAMLLPEGDSIGFALRVGVFLALVVTFYVLPIWRSDERDAMYALVLRMFTGLKRNA